MPQASFARRRVIPLCMAVGALSLAHAFAEPPSFSGHANFEGNKRGVLYLGAAPAIDGDFSDWDGFSGSRTDQVVFAGMHSIGDGIGFFVLRSDNKSLFVYADVYDATPHEVDLPAPIAWRDDSVEIYIGASTAPHKKYEKDDNHIRIVPVSKDDPSAFSLSVNDVAVTEQCTAAVVYNDQGYTIEAQIPLGLLLIKKFSANQKIRVEFQVNNASKTERDGMSHWMSPKDDPYMDASVWGDAVVLPVPGSK
jgi:hypothetical protein